VWVFWKALPRVNLLHARVSDPGPAAGRLPGSPGEVVSRFGDGTEDLAYVLDVWLDMPGVTVAAAVAVAVMSSVDARVTVADAVPVGVALLLARALGSTPAELEAGGAGGDCRGRRLHRRRLRVRAGGQGGGWSPRSLATPRRPPTADRRPVRTGPDRSRPGATVDRVQLRGREPGVLAALERARRRRRIADVDLFDAFYGAYLTGVGVLVATVVGATVVPDQEVSSATAARVADHGPAALGLLLALVVVTGVRSGGRGGPLALEAAVVQHVLMAPVGRREALRRPAVKQLRFAATVGLATGGVAGLLAARRLPGSLAGFVVAGAATGALLGTLTIGAALVVSGRRLPMLAADAAAALVVATSVVDLAVGTEVSPLTHLGLVALLPLGGSPLHLALAAAGIAVTLGVAIAGVTWVGGTSLEAAERRAGLVGQLRFAVTLQDLRSVVLLRRQLAQERSRSRPWFRLPTGAVSERHPVFVRDAQGMARFPAARLVRMGVLGVVAGLAMRGVFAGTTPLIVVAALALFVAGLDAVEPLSQDADRPERWASFPQRDGLTLVRHLPAPALAMALVGAVAVGSAALVGPSRLALELGAAVLPGAALAAVTGAAASVVMGPPDTMLRVQLPEAAGTSMVFRAVWPPGLVALALAPVAVARSSAAVPPLVAALNVEVLVVIVLGAAIGWLSTRAARRS